MQQTLLFQQAVKRLLSRSVFPVVFIVSEAESSTISVSKLFGHEVLQSPLVRQIKFLPIPPTSMKKVLNQIVTNEKLRNLKDTEIQEVMELSGGDLRHAISALQFSALRLRVAIKDALKLKQQKKKVTITLPSKAASGTASATAASKQKARIKGRSLSASATTQIYETARQKNGFKRKVTLIDGNEEEDKSVIKVSSSEEEEEEKTHSKRKAAQQRNSKKRKVIHDDSISESSDTDVQFIEPLIGSSGNMDTQKPANSIQNGTGQIGSSPSDRKWFKEYLLEQEDESRSSTLRDSYYSLFQTVGKFLYNKRLLSDGTASQISSESLLDKMNRPPLSFNPESVLTRTHADSDILIAFFHENYLNFFDEIDDVAEAMDNMSFADSLSSNRMNASLNEYQPIIVGRGLLDANLHSAPKRFQQLYRPQILDLHRRLKSNAESVRHVFQNPYSIPLSPSFVLCPLLSIQMELAPYLHVILSGPRAKFINIRLNQEQGELLFKLASFAQYRPRLRLEENDVAAELSEKSLAVVEGEGESTQAIDSQNQCMVESTNESIGQEDGLSFNATSLNLDATEDDIVDAIEEF
eukprot:GILK01014321.1.p1 GENE.GILK01014321.1~~GILK01014321.1.p1  ORF type:complete len:623 (-),score=163.06 GILK01014321.1:21-1763(-)